MAAPPDLPAPGDHGALRQLLLDRASAKHLTDEPLALPDLASALWSVAGTRQDGHRVTPSARATYPVSVTVVSGPSEQLAPGSYLYDPVTHALAPGQAGDHRSTVAATTLDAGWLASCPVLLLLSADLAGARARFPDQPPEHGERFAWIEVGHAAQNLYLWAADRGLGTVLVAGLDDAAAEHCRGLLPGGHRLLGILPVGHPAR